MKLDYYDTPPQAVFDDIKRNAIKIWRTYDDTYGYASEKIAKVNGITNIHDNAWYIVAMFDPINQEKLIDMVRPETANLIVRVRGY